MFHSAQVSQGDNSWIKGTFKRNELEDETSYLQFGQTQDKVFHTFELEPPQSTSWVNFPTKENPSNKFKFASFDIYFSQDKMVWNR